MRNAGCGVTERSELYAIDKIVYEQIQEDKKKTEATNKAYFEGMEKGADLFCKAIRDFLNKEEAALALNNIQNGNSCDGGAE